MKPAIFKSYNAQTKRHEAIDPTTALPGQTLVKMFWCKFAEKFVTVPGASLYMVDASGQMELVAE